MLLKNWRKQKISNDCCIVHNTFWALALGLATMVFPLKQRKSCTVDRITNEKKIQSENLIDRRQRWAVAPISKHKRLMPYRVIHTKQQQPYI